MKNVLKLVTGVVLCFMLSGCSDTPTLYNNNNYNGEAMKIAEGIYFKKVYIQGIYALLQCDKDGNITHNQNMNATYQNGKTAESTAVITPEISSSTGAEAKFNFKCSEITDCYNQVLIVKNSLAK